MKNKGLAALLLVSALTLFAALPSAFAASSVPDGNTETTAQETQKGQRHGKHGGKVAEPENAIGKDAAKAKALADVGVTAEQANKVKAHVSQLDDGAVIYEIHFTCDGTRYSYQINAVSGAIVDKSAEAVTEESATESRRYNRKGGKSAATVAETASAFV